MANYDHIIVSKRHLVELPAEERIKICRHDVWIDTPRLAPLFDCVNHMLYTDHQIQASCIYIYGPGGDGKTAIYKRLEQISVMSNQKMKFIELTETVDRYKPHDTICKAFGIPITSRSTTSSRNDAIIRVIEAENVCALVVDELNEAIFQAYSQKKALLSLFKSLSGHRTKLCIIAFGDHKALEVLALDPQTSRRYVRWPIERWNMDTDFIDFIATYETHLPLNLPSNLADPKMRMLIYKHSFGVMDNVVKIIKCTAMDAIAAGNEKITTDQFARLPAIARTYGFNLIEVSKSTKSKKNEK
ncbi:TniB family NTP-binding protein [Pseudomonas sp. BF-B-25]|uniref:TniB family NTP-binding protein n=1 Tax=Pseudomonas sp. BF-B-25 TaxID=2832355 RepID=UPI001CBCCD61|nr:TniB family NTP-binding protein [Pseudomonas sp. BF-B-25]